MRAQSDGSGPEKASRTEPLRLVSVDRLKDEIAAELSIVDIAGRLGIELERAGGQWRGLCPIHDEDTPSFGVAPGKGRNGLFHCFGCKAGGDEIELVRQVRHLEFSDAVAWLAEQADVDLGPYTRPATPEEKEREQLRAWCESWLDGREPGDPRVTDQSVLDEFGVGVRKRPRGDVPKQLRGKSWWLDGVIFPYRSAGGRLLGWKARQPDKKMFGTNGDFPLYKRSLFGLDVALRHKSASEPIVIVEGEYDCLALHEAGVRTAVALGGSSFLDEHAAQLAEAKVQEAVFWFDGDEAGEKAAAVVARAHWRNDRLRVRIANPWPGADPEDVVRNVGGDAALATIGRARGALEWMLRRELDSRPRDTLTDKIAYIEWIQQEFGQQLQGLREEATLREAAGWLGLSDAQVIDFARHEKGDLHAVDSERIVIGKALRDGGYFVQARKRLKPLDFFMERNQRVWSCIESVFADGLDLDGHGVITARAEAAGVPAAYVDGLREAGDGNVRWHEDRVRDMAVRRHSRNDVEGFKVQIVDPSVPAAQSIGQLTKNVTERALGWGSAGAGEIADDVDEMMEDIHEQMRNPGVAGIDLGTQLPTLTDHLNGIQARKFMLVAASSGVGKTTICLQMCAATAIGQAIPTDFVSLEMDKKEVLHKITAHLTGIDSMKIAKGQLDKDEIRAVEKAGLKIRNSPLRVHAPDGITASEFVLHARESVMERRTELFVIDYVQMTSPDVDEHRLRRDQQIGNFGYACKLKVARALDTTVICCAQLRRDAAGKEEPTPEDMGDSYDLVRAADAVLLLSQPADQDMELWIGKNRMGRGHVLIPMEHDGPSQTFRERSGGAKRPDWGVQP